MRGRPRLAVLGASGQIGWELRRALAPLGDVVAPARAEFDLADEPAAIEAAVRRLDAHVLVNAAAYTAVDRAESEPELAHRINAVGVGALARAARDAGTLLVQYSTDYVFDGSATQPYDEAAAVAPLNVYGRTKLAGENAVREAGGPHLILRTSWVYGLRGANFLRTMLRLLRERDELHVVDDQVGAPTWCRSIAEATAQILARARAASGFRIAPGEAGTFHLSAAGETSWYEFAREIARRDPAAAEQRCRRVVPITTAEYATPASRPRYSVLSNRRVAETFGIHLPDWRAQLALVLET